MIRHLNCATLRPVYGTKIVAHCLLVERPEGLLLVDSGLGTADLADPKRLGRVWRSWMRPALDPAGTAAAQVVALGHDVGDVTDVVLTHLDLDHAGGVADFPHARVHVYDAELEAALHPRGKEHGRYLPVQWSEADWVTHRVPDDAEPWFGMDAVPTVGDDVLMVPLPGHSRGHVGVAVRDGERWVLHAGDAFYAAGELTDHTDCPRRLRAMQRILAVDDAQRVATADRLRTLVADHGDEVEVVCSHDRTQLESATADA
ncbi:MBL fold metallo-hydrolase [Nocardioides marinquilinus]|uniref:MBL fold metallo-hydrolase n=1 Tax=Nocardioides marinquilinus TaxID=1210400 RepID=A0ABP9P4I4_9ACTN